MFAGTNKVTGGGAIMAPLPQCLEGYGPILESHMKEQEKCLCPKGFFYLYGFYLNLSLIAHNVISKKIKIYKTISLTL